MVQTALGRLTIPAVIALIAFLAYGSQILFYFIEPSPLDQQETIIFNILVGCIWVTYARACLTNVGWVPAGWVPNADNDSAHDDIPRRKRWCRKCEAAKPPRAHHCKICSKCVPKMDHHCPWTASCVSHRTFPHFFRFLIYSVVSMCYLTYFLYGRGAVLWEGRNLPSYLGPTVTQMILLFMLFAANSTALFVLGLLLFRNIWCLGANITTIEGWEIERHEVLVRRARRHGGYLDGPDGIRIRITKQEFPYDIGIFRNIRQGMGTSLLFWLWPFAPTPSNETGLSFDTNGFEGTQYPTPNGRLLLIGTDSSTSWPPPDPDRMPKKKMDYSQDPSFTSSDHDYIQAIRERQRQDLNRIRQATTTSLRQRQLHDRYPDDGSHPISADDATRSTRNGSGSGLAWRDSEGERLEDFGVDDEIDFYDEDDVPLAELLRRRQASKITTTSR